MKNYDKVLVGSTWKNLVGEIHEITYISPKKYSIRAKNINTGAVVTFKWDEMYKAFVNKFCTSSLSMKLGTFLLPKTFQPIQPWMD